VDCEPSFYVTRGDCITAISLLNVGVHQHEFSVVSGYSLLLFCLILIRTVNHIAMKLGLCNRASYF